MGRRSGVLVGVLPMNQPPPAPGVPSSPTEAPAAAAPSTSAHPVPSLARASGSMAVATVVSRVTGLVARLLLAAALGFGVLNDSYNIANELPNMVYELLLGGGLSSVAIRVLGRAQRADAGGGKAYSQRTVEVR